eukprot:21152-Ditylum_brightwellii.AAC.1
MPKLGGLPNNAFKKHKPIKLGFMLKNSLECISGAFRTIPSHTSKILRQGEGSNLPEGAWVGRKAWFGSVTMAVEVH